MDDTANAMLSTLTLPQIKELLAEQHNASVVQWIGFDDQDESTWPEEDGWYLSNLGLVFIINVDGEIHVNTVTNPEDNESIFVTKYAYLPTKDK